jgi:hypothetical protein
MFRNSGWNSNAGYRAIHPNRGENMATKFAGSCDDRPLIVEFAISRRIHETVNQW